MNETIFSKKPYLWGTLFSLGLIFIPYVATLKALLPPMSLSLLVVGSALLQVIVQLLFFLRLQEEKAPRLNFWALLFTLLICLIVVAGSIWIMANLDYRMMGEA